MKKVIFALMSVMLMALEVPGFDAAKPCPTREVVEAKGPWEMAQATDPGTWMPATVPGTVLGTLVANQKVPDPFWGTNNRWEDKRIPDVSRNRDFYTATFRTKVKIPADFKNKFIWMRPEGINYRSEIYLNGQLVTSTRGMFARNAVDVSEFVKVGAENELVVKVWPVDHPGSPRPKKWGAANGEWHNGGDGQIGRNVTMLMSAGWDFTFSDGVRDRNTGIWRPVTFFATGRARLDAPYVRTKLNADHSEAELTLELDVHNAAYSWGAKLKGSVVAEVEGTDVRFAENVELYRGERRTMTLKAKLAKPRLWWPANKGAQPLYVLKAKFKDARGGVSDEVKVRFGVREFTSDQSGKDRSRQFYVNGRKIFIRGTNWIPDAMLKGDDARMEQVLRLVSESGFNLVRLWGGGIVESDRFYELCDEYGLMVWQEFWMTGDTRHPDDPGLYLDNVAQALKRIRSHACMCHYVASNESTETTGTEELVKRITGTTSWMQQSECDGVHDGSPYSSVNPMRHFEDKASDRGSRLSGFNPEYGAIGLTSVENLRSFLPEKALWPIAENVKTWNYREGGGFYGLTKMHHELVKAYGAADSLEVYCRRSEAADYLQQLVIWECWNRARTAVSATGVLYWYENPPLPQLAVHGWDYQLAQTPMFFATRRANAPLHVAYEYLHDMVFVTSDVYAAHRLQVRARVFDFDSKPVWEKRTEVAVPGETAVDAFRIPMEDFKFTRPHFVVLELFDGDRKLDSNFYWRSCDKYKGPKTMTGPCTAGFEALAQLPATKLSCTASPEGLVVRNAGDRIAFMVRVKGRDAAGRYVAPVHYSDNFFSLLPGETKIVKIEAPVGCGKLEYSASAWNAVDGNQEK